MRGRFSILVVVAMFVDGASADLLWDNGIVPNGFSGRAMSPPNFPDMRVADDVTFRTGFQISDFHANVLEDDGWTHDGMITLEVRANTGYGPGAIVATHRGEFTRTDTGDDYFGRDDYEYWIEGIDIGLGAGTYWMTIRNEGGGGSGTNYWLTSDGGFDGAGSSTGYLSLDGGETFNPEEGNWNHAFVMMGVPEPSTCLLLGLGGLALLRRRR